MFTNTIKMRYNLSSKYMTQYFERRIKRMDAEIINNYQKYYIDFEGINNTIIEPSHGVSIRQIQ